MIEDLYNNKGQRHSRDKLNFEAFSRRGPLGVQFHTPGANDPSADKYDAKGQLDIRVAMGFSD